MKTIILPGFSQRHNKDWALVTQSALENQHIKTEIIEWDHWQNQGRLKFSISKELKKIESLMNKKRANFIAKSIGSYMAIELMHKQIKQINKLILCGIPLNTMGDEEKKKFAILSKFPSKRVLCLQNKSDQFGSHQEVREFVKSFNPEIEVVEHERDDHKYPYIKDFVQFLEPK